MNPSTCYEEVIDAVIPKGESQMGRAWRCETKYVPGSDGTFPGETASRIAAICFYF
jgi:hypothetical protein